MAFSHAQPPMAFNAAPLSMAAFHFLLAKTDGRDRFARTWMFFMKLVRGILYLRIKKRSKGALLDDEMREKGGVTAEELLSETGSPLHAGMKVEDPKDAAALERLSWWVSRAEQQHDITLEARRTFRFMKVVVCFFTMFRVTTVEPRWIYSFFHYVNKLGFAAFFAYDTQFWIYRHMNLASKADRIRAKNTSYRLLTFAYGAGGFYFLLQLFDPKMVALRLAQATPGGTVLSGLAPGLGWVRVTLFMLRQFANTAVCMHMGDFGKTHDCVIGPLGMFTSIFDLIRCWPGVGEVVDLDSWIL